METSSIVRAILSARERLIVAALEVAGAGSLLVGQEGAAGDLRSIALDIDILAGELATQVEQVEARAKEVEQERWRDARERDLSRAEEALAAAENSFSNWASLLRRSPPAARLAEWRASFESARDHALRFAGVALDECGEMPAFSARVNSIFARSEALKACKHPPSETTAEPIFALQKGVSDTQGVTRALFERFASEEIAALQRSPKRYAANVALLARSLTSESFSSLNLDAREAQYEAQKAEK